MRTRGKGGRVLRKRGKEGEVGRRKTELKKRAKEV